MKTFVGFSFACMNDPEIKQMRERTNYLIIYRAIGIRTPSDLGEGVGDGQSGDLIARKKLHNPKSD